MRHILFTILLTLTVHSAGAWSEPLVVDEFDGEYVVKHIVARIGEKMRALVADDEGHISQIVISSGDAREAKRGRWVLRPGTYPSDF